MGSPAHCERSTPGQVVLGDIRKQAEQASKPPSSMAAVQFLLQLLHKLILVVMFNHSIRKQTVTQSKTESFLGIGSGGSGVCVSVCKARGFQHIGF